MLLDKFEYGLFFGWFMSMIANLVLCSAVSNDMLDLWTGFLLLNLLPLLALFLIYDMYWKDKWDE